MAELIFHHQNIDRALHIDTGANQIQWSYGLNTQTMPTYGGEVVQILSAYVDDISIQGEVRTYKKMESIYRWFLEYIQIATVDSDPTTPSRVDKPVTLLYPERGWRLKIKPKGLPGYRKATDVVAPVWQLMAAVTEGDEAMNKLTMKEAAARGFDFTSISDGIGYDEDDPFTNAFAGKSAYDPRQFAGKVTDFFQSLVPSYLQGDFNSVENGGFLGSQPLRSFLDSTQKDSKKAKKDFSLDDILGGIF